MLAVLVTALWGLNFVFIKFALIEVPPFTLVALRFIFTALPAVLILPRPEISWSLLFAYGLTTFALQYVFLFSGMKLGMSAGLSSMVLQVQVFFTIGLSALFLKERLEPTKLFGALIAFLGVVIVGMHSSQDVNVLGLILLMFGALSWATGNVISKHIGNVNPLSLVCWGGLTTVPVLLVMALLFEGSSGFRAIPNLSVVAVGSFAYIVLISTHLSFSLWGWLLQKNSAATVAPFALLVPVFGFLGSATILREEITDWKVYAGVLVVSGLCINIFASRKKSIS
jgi:O-acetylserine/cysteine efflux transporter